MKFLLNRLLGLAVLSFVVGCGARADLLDGASGDVLSNDPECEKYGTECSEGADCCSGVCNDNICGSASNCSADGSVCSNASECCSGDCSDGLCGDTCSLDGQSCHSDDECCGGDCAGGICGGTTTCGVDGEECSADNECCNGNCNSSGYCGDEGGVCGHDICTVGDALDSSCSDCVQKICSVDSYCCSSYWDGVCVSEATSVCGQSCGTCQADGSGCDSPSQCCSGQCTNGVCGTGTCQGDGAWCSSPSECCSGQCTNGVCGAGTCQGDGAWCNSPSQCCSGQCTNGVCGPVSPSCSHDECQEGTMLSATCSTCSAKICTADSYCCTTYWDSLCVSEVGTICGESCGSTCKSDGNWCNSPSECCNGQCNNGVCGPPPPCAHDKCSTGSALNAQCDWCVGTICSVDSYCCSTAWDSICVGEVQTYCGQTCGSTCKSNGNSCSSPSQCCSGQCSNGVCGPPQPECAHDLCDTGSVLNAQCDWCVGSICQVDPYCCQQGWDGTCVSEVESICGKTCETSCKPEGSSCSSGSQCCSGSCTFGVCADEQTECPSDGSECGDCMANSCCEEFMDCTSSSDCIQDVACFTTCVAGGSDPSVCGFQCVSSQEAIDVVICLASNCVSSCF